MPLEFSLSSFTVSDGTAVPVPSPGVVVFVGPNNAGKTVALREISALLTNPPHPQAPTKVVKGIEARKQGIGEDLEEWLDAHARRREPTVSEPHVMYRRHGTRQSLSTLQSNWQTEGPHLHNLAPFLTFFLGGETRLGLVGSSPMWDTMNDEPQNALQLLYDNSELERQLAQAAREAFDLAVFVNRHGGLNIHLQIGEIDEPPTSPPPAEYFDRLRGLSHLHEQGDGIKSFMGIMLSVIAARYPIILSDEPEAFLHPPQARLLGRKLATLVPQGTQVFAATHSVSVLLGLLEGPAENVTIIRLTRAGVVNPAAVLTHESLAKLWSDPLLRYSNILDGLFHRGVVICEGDADSTFYSTALDWRLEQGDQPASDLLFTQCGGKDRMHIAIAALRAVRVPVRAIADFDVLRDPSTLRRIVEALGGQWDGVEELQRLLANDLASSARNPTARYVRDGLTNLLEPLGEAEQLTPDIVRRVMDLTRIETGWDSAKKLGLVALSGDTHSRAAQLIYRLSSVGLFVVPIGELERFCPPAAGLHGPAFVAQALERSAHTDEEAQKLVAYVFESFNELSL